MKVRLTLDNDMLRNAAIMRAARTAFGDGFYDAYAYKWQKTGAIDLIATAEQLVGFQVAREKLGGQNLWKALHVEILDPKPPCGRIVVDVRPLCGRC